MREIGPRPGEHPHPQHWAEVRLLALERDKGCRACGDLDGLEVHHRTYERFGREALDDVTTLCRVCHDAITGLMMRLRDERRRLPTERVTVRIERFSPKDAADIEAPIRATVEIERFGLEVAAEVQAPIRTMVEIERFVEPIPGSLPPPGRNAR